MLKRILTILMPLCGLAIFAVIVVRTGPARIAGILGAINPRDLLLAPFLMAAIALARGARWRYVMRSVGIEYGLGRATLVWTIGFFASAITPAKAGDAVRALYVRNETGHGTGESLLTVFVDRLWDLGFILVAGTVSAFWFSRNHMQIPSAPLFVAGAGLIGAVAVAATQRRAMRMLLRPAFSVLVPARHRALLSGGFHSFYDAMRAYASGPRRALTMAGLTLLCWALIFALAIYVARMLAIPVSAGYLVLIMPIITLVELLPFSVSGLGTREATVIYFFSVVGASDAQAVGFSIVYVLIGTYLTALVGFLLWLRHPVRWSRTPEP